jgi:hypothetical protein
MTYDTYISLGLIQPIKFLENKFKFLTFYDTYFWIFCSRFTQAEQGSTAINYRTNCVQNENQQQAHKEMFDPNMQQSQQQAQMYVVDKKNSDAKVWINPSCLMEFHL